VRRPLLLVLGPALLPALALEHADRAAILGIENGPKQRGLLTAMTAHLDWIRFEAGKDFVFEFVIHESITSRSGTNGKLQSEHSFPKTISNPAFSHGTIF
jgi:hypothetical protein